MDEEFRIVIQTIDRKYIWLPTAFESCDMEPQYFRDDSELERVWKRDYELIGECDNMVEVSDIYGVIGYFKPKVFIPR